MASVEISNLANRGDRENNGGNAANQQWRI
jgi:hypothetical protein